MHTRLLVEAGGGELRGGGAHRAALGARLARLVLRARRTPVAVAHIHTTYEWRGCKLECMQWNPSPKQGATPRETTHNSDGLALGRNGKQLRVK